MIEIIRKYCPPYLFCTLRPTVTEMNENSSNGNVSRHRFLKLGTGVTAAIGMLLGDWGLAEIINDKGPAGSWHNSVCRCCGTGHGDIAGMNDHNVTRIRGDQDDPLHFCDASIFYLCCSKYFINKQKKFTKQR